MRIWIVEGGEKQGPFEVYEIRDRIERHELSGRELSWHEACDEWLPLRELDVFRSEFESPQENSAPDGPPPVPVRPLIGLRILARSFDLVLYLVLVLGGVLLFSGDAVATVSAPLFGILAMLPLVAIEAGLLHAWGTTPAKVFLGIEVRGKSGAKLTLGDSLIRAIRVYVIGVGLFQPLLTLLCGGFSLWYIRRNGRAPWDAVASNKVQVRGPSLGPLIAFVMIFAILLIVLCMGILFPLGLEWQEIYPGGIPPRGAGPA